jgi:arylformamidase
MENWIDISVPIYSGMVHWPDNLPVHIVRIQDLSHGDAANVSKIEMGAHTGTHMDAPRHFLADGAPARAILRPAVRKASV